MDKEKDILARIFRDRLRHYEHPVEDDRIWAAIERDLPGAGTVPKRALWKKIALSAAAVIALLICLSPLMKNDEMTGPASLGTVVSDSRNSPSETISNKPAMPGKQATPVQMANAGYPVRIGSIGNSKKEAKEKPETIPAITPEEKNDPEINDTKINPKESTPKQDKPRSGVSAEFTGPRPVIKKKNNKFSIALVMGNGIAPSEAEKTNYFRYNLYADSDLDKIYMMNQDNTTVTNTKHNVPVSVGFSVRKYLMDNWALESGLVYTYLSSTETLSDNNGESWKKKIELHYLGLPLKAVYSFYNTGNFSLYAIAGGMGEICIYRKKTDETSGSVKQLDIPEIQWSVSAGAGLNYQLVKRIHLFAEPGIVYYFDDGNDVQTIRKKIPFNFNIQFGLRLAY